MERYVPGLELSRRLHREIVGPVLAAEHPELAYSSALLGRGSEVLGYDDPQSADHDRQARLLILLRHQEPVDRVERAHASIRSAVPERSAARRPPSGWISSATSWTNSSG